jgi:hypothetical protein
MMFGRGDEREEDIDHERFPRHHSQQLPRLGRMRGFSLLRAS